MVTAVKRFDPVNDFVAGQCDNKSQQLFQQGDDRNCGRKELRRFGDHDKPLRRSAQYRAGATVRNSDDCGPVPDPEPDALRQRFSQVKVCGSLQ